jgi:hypothetical protein
MIPLCAECFEKLPAEHITPFIDALLDEWRRWEPDEDYKDIREWALRDVLKQKSHV